MDRRNFISGAVAVLVAPLAAQALEAARIARVRRPEPLVTRGHPGGEEHRALVTEILEAAAKNGPI